MSELNDHEAMERLEAENPEAALRRRDFLERTGALVGSAALASMLPANALVAEAATVQTRRSPLPSPRNMPIDTVVVLMMENRSFDHYLGWYDKADGRNVGLEYPAPGGKKVKTHRLAPDFQGCEHPDPDHGWTGGRFQWNRGKNDGFVYGNKEGTGSDEFAAGYYLEKDVPFIPPAAKAFTLYDRYFTSLMASTYPNRHYQWSAQNGGQKGNDLPPETSERTGFTWETIMDRALAKGVSFRYYNSDLPFGAVYGQRAVQNTSPIERYYADCAAGTLPNIVFVDPPFKDGGGGDGTSADEHPHGDIRLGQAFMSDVVHAFMESPQYKRGVLFINYDEWGGFFDHVSPPRVPDQRQNNKDLNEDWSLMGFRIPAVAISPFAKGGRVAHATLGHESILKMISYRWQLGYLNKRHRYAYNIAHTLNWDAKDMRPPELPDPGRITATPCRAGSNSDSDPFGALEGLGMGPRSQDAPPPVPAVKAKRPKPHDLTLLESSGLLERIGYEVPEATPDRIFRQPDRIKRNMKANPSP